MATSPLSKDDVMILVSCIDRCIKADKITSARTTAPMIKEVYAQQQIVLEKLKQKIMGV